MLSEPNWLHQNFIVTCHCDSDHIPIVPSMMGKEKKVQQGEAEHLDYMDQPSQFTLNPITGDMKIL